MSELWVIASLILVSGVVDDLRSRKVHNALVLVAFAAATLGSIYFRGFDSSLSGLSAVLLAFILTVPLFSAGILGGGDVKLFIAFSMAIDPISMFWTLVYAMVWGALFGFTRAVLKGQLPVLVRNTYKLSSRQRVQVTELQKIPFTFALLLGWFTQLTYLHAGGGR